jgi:hypothetical protein
VSKPTIADLPERYRLQIARQLAQAQRPKTIAREPDPAPDPKVKQAFDRAEVFLRALEVRGLPRPEREWKFDAKRRWRFDYAWFERMVALEVEGVIERDARIVADGRRLLWLRTTAGGRREVVYVPLDALVQGPRPLSVQRVTTLNPLELAAAGDWLLLTSYERGRRALRLFDLARGAERPIGGTGQSHAPSLIQDFAVWSSRTGTEAWEVRYERLPAR